MYRGSSFSVANVDICSEERTEIGAQQIHMLEMGVCIRRVHQEFLAIDPNAKRRWDRVASKELIACLGSVMISDHWSAS